MVDPNLIGPSTLAISQAVGSFNAFLPKLADIRKANPEHDPSFAADVRTGELAAVALTVGVGAIVSSLTNSPVPVTVGVITALGLVILYETTLKADRPMERKTA